MLIVNTFIKKFVFVKILTYFWRVNRYFAKVSCIGLFLLCFLIRQTMKSKLKKIGMIALYVFGLGGSFFTYSANNEAKAGFGEGKGKQYWCSKGTWAGWVIGCDNSHPYSCSTSGPCP